MNAVFSKWLTYTILFGVGSTTLLVGILSRCGIWKVWFVVKRVPVLVVPSLIYGAIPGGLALIVGGIVLVVSQDLGSVLLCTLAFPLLVLSFTLTVLEPVWLKPSWYLWLERNHSDVIPILQEDARAMGRWKWQRRVSTQEGLEQWVAEVRQKRGLD